MGSKCNKGSNSNPSFCLKGIISVLCLRIKKVNDIGPRFEPMISIHCSPQAIHTAEPSFAKNKIKYEYQNNVPLRIKSLIHFYSKGVGMH